MAKTNSDVANADHVQQDAKALAGRTEDDYNKAVAFYNDLVNSGLHDTIGKLDSYITISVVILIC